MNKVCIFCFHRSRSKVLRSEIIEHEPWLTGHLLHGQTEALYDDYIELQRIGEFRRAVKEGHLLLYADSGNEHVLRDLEENFARLGIKGPLKLYALNHPQGSSVFDQRLPAALKKYVLTGDIDGSVLRKL